MYLHNLPKTTTKDLRTLGRGHGSGRGKTSGRGTKGQKARRKIGLDFEGGALRIIKRLPFLKGKGKNNSLKPNPLVINVVSLSVLPKDSLVNLELVVEKRLVDARKAKKQGVKILGVGMLKKALKVALPVSKSARLKIEKAGGSVQE